jgi:hypothetical protein
MKRSQRILKPDDADHNYFIARATRAGNDYYDEDAIKDLPGLVEGIDKPELFRNVAWGPYAKDTSNDAEFPTSPTFIPFVRGRIARRKDGSVYDQKQNLVVKFVDKDGNRRILTSPPPHDWNNEEALSILTTNIYAQIRLFSGVGLYVTGKNYIAAEQEWILANLTDGMPPSGWTNFMIDFNEQFAGEIVPGCRDARPFRTQASLMGHVDSYKEKSYCKGLVPWTVRNGAVQAAVVQKEWMQNRWMEKEEMH